MKHVLLLIITLVVVSPTFGQSPMPAASPPPACITSKFRQFDFWLGKWNVTNPKSGEQVGTSEISRASEGCAIREQWESAAGTNGMSINYYDTADHQWHQNWVGGDGIILHLHGELKGDAMVLIGLTKSAGTALLNRITWTPLSDGKVKQEWAISSDDGRTWQISFIGIYAKQP
jgi:hypothetical protein